MDNATLAKYLIEIENSDKSIEFLRSFDQELRLKGETHGTIECMLAFLLYENDLKDEAYKKLDLIIKDEILSDFQTYNTALADSVGIAISFLLENFYNDKNKDYYQLFLMGYLYLSSHIQILGTQACDSYKYRAQLTENFQSLTQKAAMESLKQYSYIPLPLSIADYYLAAKGYHSMGHSQRTKECINRAAYLHRWLDDIMVGGKDADEYSISEMADLGVKRNNLLYDSLSLSQLDKLKILELIIN